jgi:uncharacterized membrane protein
MNWLHFALFPVYAAILFCGWIFTFSSPSESWLRKEIAREGRDSALAAVLFIRFLGLILIALGAGLIWWIS